MRSTALTSLALVLFLAGCGGGGADASPPEYVQIPRLNAHEERITGGYALDGFLLEQDGVWKTGENVEGWSGTLFLAYDHQASMQIEIEGRLILRSWTWSADGSYITLDGEPYGNESAVAAWALTDDGMLQTSFVLTDAEDDSETWLWRPAE